MSLRVVAPLALSLALATVGYSPAQESADKSSAEDPADLGEIELTSNHDLNIRAAPGKVVSQVSASASMLII